MEDKRKNTATEYTTSISIKPAPVSNHVLLFAFCASVNSACFGYDIGVSTNIGPLVKETFEMTNKELEWFIGSLQFVAMIGALASQVFSDLYGRRTTFVVAAFGIFNGLIIMAMAQDYNQLLVGRMIIGLGVGVGYSVRTKNIPVLTRPRFVVLTICLSP